MRISSAKANYAGTVPVIGRLVGAAGIVSNTIKLVAHTLMKDSKASSDKEKIVSSWKRAIPLYGLKYSFDRLAKDRDNVPFMSGTAGKLDKMCVLPVFQQIIGVPRLAYHTLVLVVSGALAAGTYAWGVTILKAKFAPAEGEEEEEDDFDGEKSLSWKQETIKNWHDGWNRTFEQNKPKATRDLYRSIPVVGTFFSLAYIKANARVRYDRM